MPEPPTLPEGPSLARSIEPGVSSPSPARPLSTPRRFPPEFGLIVMSTIWGVNFVVIKTALPDIPPLAFNALRFPLASLGMLALLASTGRLQWPDREDVARLVGLGLIANVGYQVLFIVGLDRTTAGNASVLLATIPAWTTILSTWVGHERLPLRVWIGVGAALAAIPLVVSGEVGLAFGGATWVGDLLIIAAAMTWALYTVGARGMISKYGSTRVTAWTLWIGTLGILPIGAPDLGRLDLTALSLGAWFAVAYAGLLAIALAYILWNQGVKALGNARTAIYQNAVPVLALVAAWIWLGETPRTAQVVGAAVIVVSVTWAKRPVRAPADAGPPGSHRAESLRP